MLKNSSLILKARIAGSASVLVLLTACGGANGESSNQQSTQNVQASNITTQSLATTTKTAADMTTSAYNLFVSPNGSDNNPGTQDAPLRTIQRAANIVQPGTTVHVAPGVYAENITATVSGTANARIRFVSDTKWGAKIVPVGGARGMWQQEGGYTDIMGFDVDGSGSTSVRIAVALSGGYTSAQYNHVHNVAENIGCDNIGGAGLWASQSRGSSYIKYDFIGNTVDHVGGSCPYIPSIYHQSTGNIANNVVFAGSYGIHLYHDDHDVNIVNNTVFGHTGFGILYGGCQESYNYSCPTTNIKIHNNIVFDNGGGISGPIAAYDVGNEIKNNVVYANATQFDLAAPSLASMSGNVEADPQFVNYIRTGGGDYHVRSTSPAVTNGSSYAAPIDIDIKARPQGAGVTIGAYQY